MTRPPLYSIAIAHHPTLVERKSKLLENLIAAHIDPNKVRWEQGFSPAEIKDAHSQLISPQTQHHNITIKHAHGEYRNPYKRLNLGQLSLYLKHKEALRKHSLTNTPYLLILEDDAAIPLDFNKIMPEIISEFHNYNGDILHLGDTAIPGHQVVRFSGKLVHYNKGLPLITRGTHAVMFSLECSKKILKELDSVTVPIDFKYNELICRLSLRSLILNKGWPYRFQFPTSLGPS
jgi:GR25 family glycosyltransferase involved in LPS biosynthesis